MPADKLLEASELAKSYKRREVVKSVSLKVYGGEIVGLLGPTGPARPPASTWWSG